MEPLEIALDVEGVLADSHAATQARSELLTEDTCPPPNWDFPTEEHHEEFMHVSQNLWHNHNHQIPPMHEKVGTASRRLYDRHNVDIVTSRKNVNRQVREWLEGYGIEYDEFHVAKGEKTAEGDYHVHIEDSPGVARNALAAGRAVVLIDRPYNQDVDTSHDRIERVSDVQYASILLSDPPIVEQLHRLTRP